MHPWRPNSRSTSTEAAATTGHYVGGVLGSRFLTLMALTVGLGVTGPVEAAPKGDAAVIQLLQTQQCRGCGLADADLVHAQLRDADLESARLQRANLSQAQLDGANLRNADLSFTSLQGASLRGADLSGSRLIGTDLRDADLTGAVLDTNALEQAHWNGAKGMQPQAQSHAAHWFAQPAEPTDHSTCHERKTAASAPQLPPCHIQSMTAYRPRPTG